MVNDFLIYVKKGKKKRWEDWYLWRDGKKWRHKRRASGRCGERCVIFQSTKPKMRTLTFLILFTEG